MTLSSRIVFRNSFWLILLLALESPIIGVAQERPDFSHLVKKWGEDWEMIDTSLQISHMFRQEPLLDDWFGFLPIGNQGAWRQQIVVDPILEPRAHFGSQLFIDHFRHTKDWQYYNVRSPLTDASYRQGYARGQLFRIYHTQNVHERLNFYFDFSRLNSLGPYPNQQVEQSDVLLTMYYQTENGRYAFHGGFNTGFIQAEANGGLLFDTVFTDNTITDRSLVRVNNDNALQYLRNREGLFHQSYNLINRENDSLYSGWLMNLALEHRFSYLRQSYVYTDIPGFNTPEPLLQSNSTLDSTAFEQVRNALGVSIDGQYSASGHLWLETSSNEGVNYRNIQNNVGLDFQFETVFSERFPLSSKLTYVLQGVRQGGLDLYAETGFRNKGFEFIPYAQLTRAFPGFQPSRYTSNYRAWNNEFAIMTRTSFGLKLRQSFLGEINFSAMRWDAPVYYDTAAFPLQTNNASGLFRLSWHSSYSWGILRLDNRMVWQVADENDPFIQVPDLYLREVLYIEFSLFNKALDLQPGMAFTWFSPYRMKAYDPIANVFHLQTQQELGGYPLIDVFLNARIGRANFFLEFEHLNSFATGYDYWAAPMYPLPDWQFRLGIDWRFFN